MRKDSDETGESSLLKLWHRASRQGDLEARSAFQLDLEGTLLNWFHAYPGSEEASRVQSDREFVAQAFEQLWQRVVQGKVACETIPEVVAYLRASLCGAILETLRVTRLPGEVSSSCPDAEECPERGVFWGRIQAELYNQRQQRLAYLLFHCGLEPSEIVRICPQEWSDIHEVAHLRRSILVQLMHSAVLGLAGQEGGIQPMPSPINAERPT